MSEISSGDSINPFSKEALQKLQISQDFPKMAAVKPLLTSVRCRKPSKEEFVRVRQGEEYRLRCMCYFDKDSDASYIVSRDVTDHLTDFTKPTELVVCLSRSSTTPFIWPLTIPDSEHPNSWHVSALAAAAFAETQWVQIKSEKSGGLYVTNTPLSTFAEPDWSNVPAFETLLELCFRGRLIENMNHPIAKKLRGEI